MRIHFFKAPFYFAFIWFRVQRVQRVQRRRWRLSPHIYMSRCPKAGRLHPCPLFLKTFSKIKKTVQHSEKFFHFWKFVHYTEQFDPSIYFSSNDCMRRKSLSFTCRTVLVE